MDTVLQQAAGVLIALATFFAFPAVQYWLLRRLAHREGQPEVWYLPAYGFRLLMRNIPRDKTLTDISDRVFLRRSVAPSDGANVVTFLDDEVARDEEFALFPGTDHLLLCFQLESRGELLALIVTDRVGIRRRELALSEGDVVICDYAATLQNRFNFDIEIRKRVELRTAQLSRMLDVSQNEPAERVFTADLVVRDAV